MLLVSHNALFVVIVIVVNDHVQVVSVHSSPNATSSETVRNRVQDLD